MRVVGVNGIACHGEHNIDLLLAALELRGLNVADVNLPLRHWFSARWRGCSDGQIVARHSNDGDILVAHSFGCLRAWHAHRVRNYRAVICIAPAMSQHALWDYPERVHCYYSPRDWAIRIGARLLFHPFGAAGTKGFSQFRVTNHRTESGHSDYFRTPLLELIADHIAGIAR